MEELIIGSHVSFTKDSQLLGSLKEALSYNANTFMFYTGAPQNTNRAPISEETTKKAHQLMSENNIDINNIIVHAPYIINPSNKENVEFAINFLKQEIDRVSTLGITKLVLHPGSHVGQGEHKGIENTIYVLNQVINKDTNVIICLETMAGKGSEIGKNFNEIKQILDGIKNKDKVKVCLDTCHIHDAGYDLSDIDETLDEFDKIIGLQNLFCIHINDSKNIRESHKDRHENFGYGAIGFENLMTIIYHPKLKNIPKILETPYVGANQESKDKIYPPYKFEIEMIKNKQFNPNLLEHIREFYK